MLPVTPASDGAGDTSEGTASTASAGVDLSLDNDLLLLLPPRHARVGAEKTNKGLKIEDGDGYGDEIIMMEG